MAAIKLLVLVCLISTSYGYNAKRSPEVEQSRVDVNKEPGTGDIQPPKDELQPGPSPPEATGQKVEEGNPTAMNRGDLSEYKQWPTPEFEVKQKSDGKPKAAPTKQTTKGSSAVKSKASPTTSKKTASKTTTKGAGTKPAAKPATKKTTTTKSAPQKTTTVKKGGAAQNAKTEKGTAGGKTTVHRVPAKKGLIGDKGGSGKKEDKPEGDEKPKDGNEDIIPKTHTDYNDLLHPVPSKSEAEHFFKEVAKPMPTSKGCKESYDGELPKIIIPHHYDLGFKFDVKNMKFWGHELIYVEVNVSKLEYFFLHSADLEIAEILYIDSKEQKAVLGHISNVDPKDKQITVTLESPQETKNGFISVKWRGDVSEILEGIYKTTAIDMTDPEDPKDYEAISTQFEPAAARKAFPCIDEPAVKATFNQTLITQAENAALANGKEENEEELPEDKDGVKWKKVTFGRTPKMSTFLVAFFAGNFDYIEGKSKNNGIRIRIYTARGKKQDGEYAMEAAIEALDYLEKHFTIDFPMPKIDMIAVPDYAQGAMENWGIITFREMNLLIPEGEKRRALMEACKQIVCHEMVHQWFGNLVTHRWWPYLWLKEGFAQFMQSYIIDKLNPEWKVLNTFTTNDYMNAMNGDANVDSHAIEVKVDKVADVGEIFDDVSYAKGASLLRWLMDWLGEETMQKGYIKYLSENKFATACSSDLWMAMEEASGKPVAKVMENWVGKKGYPMISAMIMNKNSTSVTIKMIQKRFSLTPPGIDDKDDLWSIPLKFITSREDENGESKGEKTKSEFMFEKKSYEVTIPMDGFSSLDWIKINPGSIGFYLTKYLEPLSFRLVDPIMEQSLGYIDRVSVIHELFQQVMAGERAPIEYLNFVKAYREDPNYYVWQAIDGHISKLALTMSNTNFGDQFKVFCQFLYGSIYEKIPSWDPIQGEGGNEAGLKATIIKRLGFSGHKSVVEKARQYFDDEYSGKKNMPKTLKGIIFSVVTRRMNDTEVKSRIRKFVDTDDESEKAKLQLSFVHVQDESQIKAVIKLSFSKYIRSMDSLTILGGLASTSLKARTLVWRFLVQNAAEFKKRYDGNNNFAKFLKGLLSGFASKSVLDKMKENLEQIVREHNFEGVDMAVKQGYDFGISNYNFLLRGGQELSSYLSEFAQIYTA